MLHACKTLKHDRVINCTLVILNLAPEGYFKAKKLSKIKAKKNHKK